MKLTILMPCLNEEKTVANCIRQAMDFLRQYSGDGEVLVVDNGSTDNSVLMAKDAGARVVSYNKTGYGNALRFGIQEARGQYVIMGDCDESYDFMEAESMIKALEAGADLVIGNRFSGEWEEGAMPFAHRYIGVPFLSWLGRIRYHTDINDFHCGLRGFRRKEILAIGLKSDGMEFATEMIGRAAAEGLRIVQVPVTLHKDGRNAPSHLRSIRDGCRHLKMIFWNR